MAIDSVMSTTCSIFVQQTVVPIRQFEESKCVPLLGRNRRSSEGSDRDQLRRVLGLLCFAHLHKQFSVGETHSYPTVPSHSDYVSVPLLCFIFLDLGNVLFQRLPQIVNSALAASAVQHMIFFQLLIFSVFFPQTCFHFFISAFSS